MNMGNQIGGAITASLTPVIAKHYGWGASFFVAATLCVLGSLMWLLVDPTKELASEPRVQPANSSRREEDEEITPIL
jgi:MFS transporter, ACS family, glucarate transporter